MKQRYETIIIGAGFSGLAAGLKLKEVGMDFAIFEARTRAGGRTQTDWINDDLQIDLGGQWFGPTQNRAYDFIQHYGLETFPTQLFGKSQYVFNGMSQHALTDEMVQLLQTVDHLAEAVNLHEPTLSPHIDWQDRMTFQSWLEKQTTHPETIKMVGRMLAGGLLGADAGEVSLFQILFYIKSGNGVNILLGADGGAQQDRLVGGPQKLAACMAADLNQFISWDAAVTKISQNKDHTYTVVTQDGRQAVAQKVLVTVPPVVLNKQIEFHPALPKLKRQMIEHMLPGSVLKYHAIYESPFWREQGLSGQVNTSDGFIMEAVDNSVPGHDQGVLTFFVYGMDVTRLEKMSEEEQYKVLLEALVALYGEQARNIKELITQDWSSQKFTYGCFSGHFVPGAFMQFGELRDQQVGHLFFAGTETANYWNGYIEGAIRSGEREAAKMIG